MAWESAAKIFSRRKKTRVNLLVIVEHVKREKEMSNIFKTVSGEILFITFDLQVDGQRSIRTFGIVYS